MPTSTALSQSRPFMILDTRYLKGIELFNQHAYFDAHEVWEELWHEEQGDANHFVQGLIQFATALHHFESQNLKGTRLLYLSGVELLSPYGDVYWRLPVKKLIDDMSRCVEGVLRYSQEELPGRYHPDKDAFPVKLNPRFLPVLQLLPGSESLRA